MMREVGISRIESKNLQRPRTLGSRFSTQQVWKLAEQLQLSDDVAVQTPFIDRTIEPVSDIPPEAVEDDVRGLVTVSIGGYFRRLLRSACLLQCGYWHGEQQVQNSP